MAAKRQRRITAKKPASFQLTSYDKERLEKIRNSIKQSFDTIEPIQPESFKTYDGSYHLDWNADRGYYIHINTAKIQMVSMLDKAHNNLKASKRFESWHDIDITNIFSLKVILTSGAHKIHLIIKTMLGCICEKIKITESLQQRKIHPIQSCFCSMWLHNLTDSRLLGISSPEMIQKDVEWIYYHVLDNVCRYYYTFSDSYYASAKIRKTICKRGRQIIKTMIYQKLGLINPEFKYIIKGYLLEKNLLPLENFSSYVVTLEDQQRYLDDQKQQWQATLDEMCSNSLSASSVKDTPCHSLFCHDIHGNPLSSGTLQPGEPNANIICVCNDQPDMEFNLIPGWIQLAFDNFDKLKDRELKRAGETLPRLIPLFFYMIYVLPAFCRDLPMLNSLTCFFEQSGYVNGHNVSYDKVHSGNIDFVEEFTRRFRERFEHYKPLFSQKHRRLFKQLICKIPSH